jgi:hypothetical protein
MDVTGNNTRRERERERERQIATNRTYRDEDRR